MSKTAQFLTAAATAAAPTAAMAHGGHSPAEGTWHVLAHSAPSTPGIVAIAAVAAAAVASGTYLHGRGEQRSDRGGRHHRR